MTDPANPPIRKRTPRRSGGGAGQWMLGVVIGLAVIGTGLWMFSDDKRWGLVALIMLIWGLVIAAFLIARYARDLRAAESKESGLKTVYELQLEREISARREYELRLEHDIRAEMRDESNEELTALKAEVLALRANLEELLGRDPGPSYSELYAAAEQRALAAQQAKSVFEDDDRFRAQQDFAGVPVPEPASDVDDYYGATSVNQPDQAFAVDPVPPVGPVGATDLGGPGRQQEDAPTAVFQSVTDDGPAPEAEPRTEAFAQATPPEQQWAPEQQPVDVEHVEHSGPAGPAGFAADEPFVPLAPQSGYRPPFPPRRFAPEPEATPEQQWVPDRPWQAEQPAQEPPRPEQAWEPEQPEGADRDEVDHTQGQHTSGSTVAELIARMNADTERSGGRRRRPE